MTRSLAKKLLSSAAHSSPSTPAVTAKRWLSRGSEPIVKSVFSAPALGSGQPYTTLATRAFTSAPAHIGQGLQRANTVAPSSLQCPSAAAARRRRVDLGMRRGILVRLASVARPRPTIAPVASTTTAPTRKDVPDERGSLRLADGLPHEARILSVFGSRAPTCHGLRPGDSAAPVNRQSRPQPGRAPLAPKGMTSRSSGSSPIPTSSRSPSRRCSKKRRRHAPRRE